MKKMKFIISVGTVLMIGIQSQAALIAYEGFDYTTGQDLSHSTTGGSGWATASYGGYEPGYSATWNSNPTTVAVASGSLGLSGLESSTGNSIKLGGTVSDATRVVGDGTSVVDLSQDGSVFYFSYLIQASDLANGSEFAGVRFNGQSYLYISETSSSSPRLKAYVYGGSISYDWGNAVANDTTYLIVGKYWNDNGTVKMNGSFFADGDSLDEPATWMIEASNSYTSQAAYQIEFIGTANSTINATLDEFRLGTTFEDVAPIPEPATIGLFGIATIGLLSFRRFSTGG